MALSSDHRQLLEQIRDERIESEKLLKYVNRDRPKEASPQADLLKTFRDVSVPSDGYSNITDTATSIQMNSQPRDTSWFTPKYVPRVETNIKKDNTVGWLETAGRSLAAGVGDVQTNMLNMARLIHKGSAELTNIILPDSVYDIKKDVVADAFDKAIDYQKNAVETIADPLYDLEGAKSFVSSGLRGIPPVVSSALMAYAVPSAVDLSSSSLASSKTIAQSFVKNYPNIARMIPFGIHATGGGALRAEEEGANYTQQVVSGVLTGMGEMATESIPFEYALKTIRILGADKLVEAGSRNLIKRYGRAGLNYLAALSSEVLQEVAMEPIEGIIKKGIYDSKIPWKGDGGVFDPHSMYEAGVGGLSLSVMLGALGLPFTARSHVMARRAIRQGNTNYNQVIQDISIQLNKDLSDTEAGLSLDKPTPEQRQKANEFKKSINKLNQDIRQTKDQPKKGIIRKLVDSGQQVDAATKQDTGFSVGQRVKDKHGKEYTIHRVTPKGFILAIPDNKSGYIRFSPDDIMATEGLQETVPNAQIDITETKEILPEGLKPLEQMPVTEEVIQDEVVKEVIPEQPVVEDIIKEPVPEPLVEQVPEEKDTIKNIADDDIVEENTTDKDTITKKAHKINAGDTVRSLTGAMKGQEFTVTKVKDNYVFVKNNETGRTARFRNQNVELVDKDNITEPITSIDKEIQSVEPSEEIITETVIDTEPIVEETKLEARSDIDKEIEPEVILEPDIDIKVIEPETDIKEVLPENSKPEPVADEEVVGDMVEVKKITEEPKEISKKNKTEINKLQRFLEGINKNKVEAIDGAFDYFNGLFFQMPDESMLGFHYGKDGSIVIKVEESRKTIKSFDNTRKALKYLIDERIKSLSGEAGIFGQGDNNRSQEVKSTKESIRSKDVSDDSPRQEIKANDKSNFRAALKDIGERAGLKVTGNLIETLTDKQQSIKDNAEDLTGLSVFFYKSDSPIKESGISKGTRIFLNASSDIPVHFTVGHEMTHAMSRLRGIKKEFANIMDAVGIITEKQYKDYVKTLKASDEYKASFTKEQAKEAMIADTIGNYYNSKFGDGTIYVTHLKPSQEKTVINNYETLVKKLFESAISYNRQPVDAADAQARKLTVQTKQLRTLQKELKEILPTLKGKYRQDAEKLVDGLDWKVQYRTKKTMGKLKAIQQYLQSSPDAVVSRKTLEKLEILNKKPIQHIPVEDLSSIVDAIRQISFLQQRDDVIRLRGHIIKKDNYVNKIKSNISKRNPRIVNTQARKFADHFRDKNSKFTAKEFLQQNMTAETLTRSLDGRDNGSLQEVFHGNIKDGFRVMADYYNRGEQVIKAPFDTVKSWSTVISLKAKDIDWIDTGLIDGNERILISPAEAMDIYNNTKNNHNYYEMLENGLVFARKREFAPIDFYKESDDLRDARRLLSKTKNPQKADILRRQVESLEKQARSNALVEMKRLINNIVNNLTSVQMQTADRMMEYLNTDLKDGINKVSREKNGDDVAKVENYWRCEHAGEAVGKKYTEMHKRFLSHRVLEEAGFLKPRKGSRVPIVVRDAFEKYHASVDDSAKYIGLAEPIRTARMILEDTDLQRTFQQRGLKNELEHLRKHIDFIEGSYSTLGTADTLMEKGIRNIYSAIISANLDIASKQTISYITAKTELDMSDWAHGLKSMVNKDVKQRMMKYSPIAYQRMRGLVHPEMGEIAQVGEVARFATGKQPWQQKLSGLVQFLDIETVGRIWNAVEHEVQRKQPNLKGDSFYKAVAERWEDIVDKTQVGGPIYTTSTFRKEHPSSQWKAATMFTSQKNKCFNTAYRGWMKYQESGKTPDDLADLLFNTFLSAVAQSVTVGAVTAAWQRLRKVKNPNDFINPWDIFENIVSNMYFVGDALSIVSSFNKYGWSRAFRLSNPVFDSITDVAFGVGTLYDFFSQVASGEVYTTGLKEDEQKYITTARRAAKELPIAITALFYGLPLGNIQRYTDGIIKHAFPEAELDMDAFFRNPQTSEYYNYYWDAIKRGDKQAAGRYFKNLRYDFGTINFPASYESRAKNGELQPEHWAMHVEISKEH